jgi:hypothetical protein
MASEDARAAYVKLIMELDPAWSLQPADADVDAALLSERKQSWVVFSSMQDAGCCATPPPHPTPPHPTPPHPTPPHPTPPHPTPPHPTPVLSRFYSAPQRLLRQRRGVLQARPLLRAKLPPIFGLTPAPQRCCCRPRGRHPLNAGGAHSRRHTRRKSANNVAPRPFSRLPRPLFVT